MIDIKFLRENPDVVKQNIKNKLFQFFDKNSLFPNLSFPETPAIHGKIWQQKKDLSLRSF